MKNTIILIVFCCWVVFFCSNSVASKVESTVTTHLAGKTSPAAIPSVLRIINLKDNKLPGTGFVHKSGVVITAEHVVSPLEAKEIGLVLSSGQQIAIKSVIKDQKRDLAILHPATTLNVPTLVISQTLTLHIGDQVAAWGFPAGYRGFSALLSVGYLSGVDQPGPKGSPEQWVINAAFNGGNSGGPVVRMEDGNVIGVVSSKLAPMPQSVEAALKGLSAAKFGLEYTKKEAGKEPSTVYEGQVVASVLEYLRSQTQLVLGFAVKLGDLRDFLKENAIEP